MQLVYGFPRGGGRCDAQLTWNDKRPTRLPEAFWWSFQPQVLHPRNWKLEKIGQLIDPCTVVSHGGRSLHGVDRGAFYRDDQQQMALFTADAHLIAPGRPQLYEFTDEIPDMTEGLHFNLYNNLWGTNFPMWCSDDLGFRTSLCWSKSTDAPLVSPWEINE